jgi:hypothetical protein
LRYETPRSLLELLLNPKLIAVAALLLPAVACLDWQTSVAPGERETERQSKSWNLGMNDINHGWHNTSEKIEYSVGIPDTRAEQKYILDIESTCQQL